MKTEGPGILLEHNAKDHPGASPVLFGEIAGKAGCSTCCVSIQAWSSASKHRASKEGGSPPLHKAFNGLFSLFMGCLSQLGSGQPSTYCGVKLCHGHMVRSQVKEKLLVELVQVCVSSAVPGH